MLENKISIQQQNITVLRAEKAKLREYGNKYVLKGIVDRKMPELDVIKGQARLKIET